MKNAVKKNIYHDIRQKLIAELSQDVFQIIDLSLYLNDDNINLIKLNKDDSAHLSVYGHEFVAHIIHNNLKERGFLLD